jgi:hypothetical protein
MEPGLFIEFSRGLIIYFLLSFLYWSVQNEQRKLLDYVYSDSDTDSDTDDLEPVRYEDKYPLEIDELEILPVDTDNLLNCFVIETTPIGNVLMNYNHKKETFDYFSDMSMPYRFLLVVCRKYVMQFNCVSLYVKSEIKELENNESDKKSLDTEMQKKKNVFAKFKNYNVDSKMPSAGPGPPKNSIPQPAQQTGPVLLKDKINRFSYQGKFNNFSILKKVDRKLVDKKLAMTFADFKKLKNL